MENTPMKKILISLVALSFSSAAFAQMAAAPSLASADTDASGGVSWTEAQVLWPDLTQEQFTSVDADASGELSADEFATLPAPAAAP
jgi:hypothetical protein